MGKVKCGRTAKTTGEPCRKGAGYGTDHVGFGACKYHGGCSLRKHGLYSDSLQEYLREKYEQALDDPRLTKIEEQIALKSTLLTERINSLKTRESLTQEESEGLLKISEAVSRDIERWHKMKHGETHVIRIEKVEVLIRATVDAANEYIPEPEDRKKFLEKLKNGIFSQH